ncbi:transporter substrate-binding domain-containing protein [Guyparkeria halopsychrophila]|uniref:substrate-binding periplasmic protein n=1 Tax=Guyparkeria halopsychrophila TaxID=3139421 RepID=UPI0037C6C176
MEGTEDRVRDGSLRVGVIDGVAPWVTWNAGDPRGVESQLVRELAERLGADVQWVKGSDTELFGALAAFELDLVIGGIERSSPWGKEVALTRPYHETRMMLGWPDGQRATQELSGQRVEVEPNTALARKLKKRGAVPVALVEQRGERLPIAAAEWQIEAWGMQASPPVLDTQKRVFALPPGENRWLQTVQRFLFGKREGVPAMLRAELSAAVSTLPADLALPGVERR